MDRGILGGTMGGGEGNHYPPSHLSRPLLKGEETAVSPLQGGTVGGWNSARGLCLGLRILSN